MEEIIYAIILLISAIWAIIIFSSILAVICQLSFVAGSRRRMNDAHRQRYINPSSSDL
jgi:hypothetical protein